MQNTFQLLQYCNLPSTQHPSPCTKQWITIFHLFFSKRKNCLLPSFKLREKSLEIVIYDGGKMSKQNPIKFSQTIFISEESSVNVNNVLMLVKVPWLFLKLPWISFCHMNGGSCWVAVNLSLELTSNNKWLNRWSHGKFYRIRCQLQYNFLFWRLLK